MIRFEASFDDGSHFDLKTVALLDKYGFSNAGSRVVTFYIPAHWESYLATKDIEPLPYKKLVEIGERFEIGSHSINHHLLTRFPMEVVKHEIEGSKVMLEKMFNRPITKFCYPRGYYNEEIKKLVQAAGYESARTVKVCELTPAADPFETHTTVHIGLDRQEYGTDWLTFALDKLTEAVTRSGAGEEIVYHFWGHSEEINRLDQWDRFESFLKTLQQSGVS